MKLLNALTRFDGRISRTTFWLGLATVIVVFGFARYFLKAALGYDSFTPDAPVVTALTALAAAPLAALMVQRLADRGRPSWLGYAYGAITAIFVIAPQFGVLGFIESYSFLEHIVFWPSLALTLFTIVEAGFLPGRSGDSGFKWARDA